MTELKKLKLSFFYFYFLPLLSKCIDYLLFLKYWIRFKKKHAYASLTNATPIEYRKFLYRVNSIKLGNKKLVLSTSIKPNTTVINTPQAIIGITTGFHLFSGYNESATVKQPYVWNIYSLKLSWLLFC